MFNLIRRVHDEGQFLFHVRPTGDAAAESDLPTNPAIISRYGRQLIFGHGELKRALRYLPLAIGVPKFILIHGGLNNGCSGFSTAAAGFSGDLQALEGDGKSLDSISSAAHAPAHGNIGAGVNIAGGDLDIGAWV